MRRRMVDEEVRLLAALKEVAPDKYFTDSADVFIDRRQVGRVFVRVADMYECIPVTFAVMNAVGEFFSTANVNVLDREETRGCDTCDYGSEYAVTFEVLPP